jgi:hypothetical protein
MPPAYLIDSDQRLVVITGEYADEREWARLLGHIVSDPRRQPGFGFLRDLRDAVKPVDAAVVLNIMDVVRRFWSHLQPSRAAILTPDAIDAAALVAVAIADGEGLPLRVFTSYDEAVEWLRHGDPTAATP